ncbi:G5 domain-containing protein [Cryobacterium sp. SO2]|uniref:G5 domain-containing protein n=1 Tax=Cryobacterium sp. SO2 TaxID=1897060 RepID=UPI00223D968A|nr:G5 domain-containing protein [Cryobacterium sp. SO2]WEO76457.1 G5 domain-containing protein [Cryobacterium sp. SO2]
MSLPQPPVGGPFARFRGPAGRIPTRTRWMIAGVIVLGIVVTSVMGIFWALVSLLGLLGLIFGIVAVVKGAAPLARLRSRKAGVLAIILSLVLLLFGSGANAAVQQSGSNLASLTAQSSTGTTATPQASPSATPRATTKPTAKPKSTPTPTPVATEAEVQEASVLPYAAVTVDDAGIDVGTSAVTVSGGNGEKVTTYLVKYIDGVEVSRSVAREETTVQPVDEVTSVGTRVPAPVAAPAPEPAPVSDGCDPNYADACVPIASDVDCAGGSGDGPGYVDGPVRIVGNDIYDLDRDGDGIACDS